MRATGLLTELSLSPLDAADTARLAEAISGRPLPEPDADLLQAATGGFPLYIVEAMHGRADADGSAACRPAISAPCSVTVSSRRPRRPGRSPASRRRWGADFTLDLLTEASDLDAGTWWEPSTSCGGAGSCASTATATTSPTTCSARRRTRWSARRSGGCCIGAWRRRSSCCIPTTRTRSRLSSRSSTPAAGDSRGR